MKWVNSVKADRYDPLAFEWWIARQLTLRELSREGGEVLPNFPFLLEDIFRYLYKEKPQLRPEEKVYKGHQFQREIIEVLQNLGLDQLRQQTTLNEENAVLATGEVGKFILDLLKKRQTGTSGQGDGDSQEENELMRLLRELLDAARGSKVGDLLAHAKTMAEEEAQAKEEAQEIVDGIEAGLGAREKFVNNLEEFKRALMMSEPLRRFARAFGRLLATDFKRNLDLVVEPADEFYDTDEGRDLSRLTPFEKARLAHPVLAQDFWRRFFQGRLTLHRFRTRRPLGRGPKIYLVDLSGSTHEVTLVRQSLEKLIVAAATFYSRKNVPFLVFYFQGPKEIKRLRLQNPLTSSQFDDLATHYGQGGTNFEGPLRLAANAIDNKPEFRRADIIMITDGEDSISDLFAAWFNEEKKRLHFALATILIDWKGNVKDDALKKVSDKIVLLSELIPQEILEEINRIYGEEESNPEPAQPDYM